MSPIDLRPVRTKGAVCFISTLIFVGGLPGLQSASAQAPTVAQPAVMGQQTAEQLGGKGQKSADTEAGLGQKTAPSKDSQKSEQQQNVQSMPASPAEQKADAQKLKLGPLDPAPPPTGLPTDRPVIGLALGGGSALAISEIGTLQWLEEHHIPVDVIAGTSMGSIIAALYSTGVSPERLKQVLNPEEVTRIFRIGQEFSSKSFRRREDSRQVPNAVGMGLRHGVSLRNALLTDTGLNELLAREFIRYSDQTEFNSLPIPFRCRATDVTVPQSVAFARGSLHDAVRASASLPGVFQPFEMNGHYYVDGAILSNLPTADVKEMKADVIIAFSLPLSPAGPGDLDSILGVVGRAFSVGIEVNEAQERKLADVLIMPDISGFTAASFSRSLELAQRGYEATEAHKAELMKYSLPDDQWEAYVARRRAKERPPAGTVLQVRVSAPTPQIAASVQRRFDQMVNQPVDPLAIQALLAEIRSDGRYNASYTVRYTSPDSNRPILLVNVEDKSNGPPFLNIGFNIQAQSSGVTRATVDTIFLYQDLGGYGSELRAKFDFGFLTNLEGEYFHRFRAGPYFVAPRASLTREPFYIYASPDSNTRISERQSQFGGVAADLGWTDSRIQELRVGWQFNNVQWHVATGQDNLPDYDGNSQTVRIRYVYDSQDRAFIPHFGLRLTSSFGYLYGVAQGASAPQFLTQFRAARTFSANNVLLIAAEGGTMFNHDVAQPFRYTLGGPLRLASLSIDQLRGTDYWLTTPGYLRRFIALPAPLNGGVYLGGAFEAGQMRAPDTTTITREDVYFGIVASMPVGVVSFGPAIGFNGDHKFTFTIGRFF